MFLKHHTEETKRKMRESHIGKKRKPYRLVKPNTGCFKKSIGKNKSLCIICKREVEDYVERKFCSRSCLYKNQKGKKRPEHSKKMKGHKFLQGKKLTLEHRKKLSGSNSPRWRGGITTLYHSIRRLPEYFQWRNEVFTRDNFTCIFCLNNTKERIEADHIKTFALIIFENKVSNISEALACKELWNIENGRTLCHTCHKSTETYGKNLNSTTKFKSSLAR